MARCPFAKQDPIRHDGAVFTGGTYTGGPFKIVHHTTEGSSSASARATYARTGNMPHFTVDSENIFQHIDTDRSATALANDPGGVQTNRDSAIQIEVVGRAASPKSQGTLQNIRRLCRWIEETHEVAKEWPNGFPKPPSSSHNRDSRAWNERSGHYGHCHVPENDHEDPGYTKAEVAIIMAHTPVAVSVDGSPVSDANGFLEGDTTWAAVRAVVEAMGGTVDPSADQITVRISFRSQTITVTARGVASGTAFVPLRELRRLTGVGVDFTPGDAPRVNIRRPAP